MDLLMNKSPTVCLCQQKSSKGIVNMDLPRFRFWSKRRAQIVIHISRYLSMFTYLLSTKIVNFRTRVNIYMFLAINCRIRQKYKPWEMLADKSSWISLMDKKITSINTGWLKVLGFRDVASVSLFQHYWGPKRLDSWRGILLMQKASCLRKILS